MSKIIGGPRLSSSISISNQQEPAFKGVLDFWFGLGFNKWFGPTDTALDNEIKNKFGHLIEESKAGKLKPWRSSAKGRLAEIIVLDQFSRQVFRGKKEAFAQDELALSLTLEGVKLKQDQELNATEKMFFYLPIEHAENAELHTKYQYLFEGIGGGVLQYFMDHKKVCAQFGRYPSRNATLGRQSTDEELMFMKSHKGW